MQFPDFPELYCQLALSALVSVVRFLSLCPGIRTMLTSLMTGLKQSLWNRSRSRGARNYVCIVRSFLRWCSRPEGELETASWWNPRCSHRAARNLREIVSPDLPNERHRDFVNHSSSGEVREGRRGSAVRRHAEMENRLQRNPGIWWFNYRQIFRSNFLSKLSYILRSM